jgi:methionyl aminopeptidase
MIPIKTEEEIKIMVEGGRILAKIMAELGKQIRPGLVAKELEGLAEVLIFKYNGKPSFKGYDGFPACLCVSLNEQVVHGLPDNRIIKNSDLVSLDLGINYQGFHTDMARTFAVGKTSPLAKKLISVTKKALENTEKMIRPGNRLGDISQAIQQYVQANSFNVVRELCGHGIGRELHEDPQILNFVGDDYGGDEEVILKEGMTICIEPMVTTRDWRLKKSADGFGYETKDGSLSCHFEDTIIVTKSGSTVLTKC